MRNTLKALAVAAGLLAAACATSPAGGTNPVATEGQTLGGYVATGAVDPDNAEGARTGDDDQTPPATEAQKPPASEEQKPPRR